MTDKYCAKINGKFTDVLTVDQICDYIKERVRLAEQQAAAAQAELNLMSLNQWKDKELVALNQEIANLKKDLQRSFEISEAEQAIIKTWQHHHREKYHLDTNYLGGNFHYIFYPTSVGTVGVCVCTDCKQKIEQQIREEWLAAQKEGIEYDYSANLRKAINEHDVELEFQSLR